MKGDATALVHKAHEHNVSVLMNMQPAMIAALAGWDNYTLALANGTARELGARAVALAASKAGYDGLCLDIEVNAESNRDALSNFTGMVRGMLHPGALLTFGVGSTVYLNGSKAGGPFFDYVALARACDWFFVMGYSTCSTPHTGMTSS
jgi:spore germination protein YaaH